MTQFSLDVVTAAADPAAATSSLTPSADTSNGGTDDHTMAPPGGTVAQGNAATPAPTARPGLQSTGPWIVGEVYNVVPAGPLALVPDKGEKWYAITKGRYVGVTNSAALADGAVSRVSHALRQLHDTQAEAAEAFNTALASPMNLIEVV
ncbi:hypothetical protein B0H11DRAFT_2246837 [Mycena galericulata]|nr:hypothetical protein B0H11DRAFT_2246837 [Mycena galericulata]